MHSTPATPGPRPTDPRQISFDRRCFAVVGQRTVYSVLRSALHPGPAKFGTNKAAAEEYARRCGRAVHVSTEDVLARVSWT